MFKLASLVALAACAVLAAGPANAGSLGTPKPVVKKYPVPSLNIGTRPHIPKICPNELSKGPGAKKCG